MGQLVPHTPAAHVAVPPVGAGHALPQRPQCAMAVLVLASQPLAGLMSQSPKPALQVNPHVPETHEGVALAAVHVRPHAPQ
jgi:hypothetical protein